jgi:hypothetical protein
VGPRADVRADGNPGSAWDLDLGERVPCERLRFDAAEADFARPFRLEEVHPDHTVTFLTRGEWRRRDSGEQKPLEIVLPRETFAGTLRLVVTDYRNPPLSLTGARVIAPARQLVLAGADLAGPLRLYFGNPQAQAPNYDFAASLPLTLDPPPAPLSADGAVQQNPDYRPTPKPWAERHPWLVYVVLGAASAVLLGVLGALARQALNRMPPAEGSLPTAGPGSEPS